MRLAYNIIYVSCIINEFSTECPHNGLDIVVLPTIILVSTSKHMFRDNRILNFLTSEKKIIIGTVQQFQI